VVLQREALVLANSTGHFLQKL
jgi:hypothetical protein